MPRYQNEDDDDLASRDDESARRPVSRTSGMALASLLCGLLTLGFCPLPGLVAILLGILALVFISQSRGELGGKGLAITGLVLGLLSCVVSAVSIPLVLLPAVDRIRHGAATVAEHNNMMQIGLAMQNYHDTYGHLPPAVIRTREGKPGLSWRVALLPYLEEGSLYQQFKLDEPWDSPNNRPLLDRMPKVYRSMKDAPGVRETHYRVFVGKGAPFSAEPLDVHTGRGAGNFTSLRFIDITDGTADTISVVEATQGVPWTKPEELAFDPQGALPELGYTNKEMGFLVVTFDGAVHFLPKNLSERTLRAAIGPQDGIPLGSDWSRSR